MFCLFVDAYYSNRDSLCPQHTVPSPAVGRSSRHWSEHPTAARPAEIRGNSIYLIIFL